MNESTISAAVNSLITITSSFGTLDGWGTDGKRTLQEDLVDIGGGRIAYAAWKATIEDKDVTNIKASGSDNEGFTPDQIFFFVTGRLWRAKREGKSVIRSHAAPFARVNSTVMQMHEFADAFGCKSGDQMYFDRDKISPIW